MRLDMLIGEHLGRYQIEALLGRGGMAAVYRALDPALQRAVALKVLYPQFLADPELVERFRREAITAAALDHPHIVPIYDVGEADGMVYLAMKLLPGPSLAEVLQHEGRLPLARVAGLANEIAAALDEAHHEGIVHRDIKPGNVLFDRHGRAILTDFGIAKSLESTALTETSVLIGTPDYIAPEQIDHELAVGGKVDARADIYAFGALLYRALTGRRPFEGTAQTVFLAHLRDEPRPPSLLAPELPPRVDRVLARAMAKRPENRYGSAGELARDLEETLGDATIIGAVFPGVAPRRETEPRTPAEVVQGRRIVEAPRRGRPWRTMVLVAMLLSLLGSAVVLRQMLNRPQIGDETTLAAMDPVVPAPEAGDGAGAHPTTTASPTIEASATPFATTQPSATASALPQATATPEAAPLAAATSIPPAGAAQPIAAGAEVPLLPKQARVLLPSETPFPPSATPSPSPSSTASPSATVTTAPPSPTVTTVPPSPTVTTAPTETPAPTRTPSPTPEPTSRPVLCDSPPVSGFGKLWSSDGSIQAKLGCPVQPEGAGPAAEQVFENGLMYWWSPSQQIFVLAGEGSGEWSVFPNTYADGEQQTLLTPPLGAYSPERGFGEVWRNYPALGNAIGWGKAPELALTGVHQRFERGLMLYSWELNGHPRQIYVLFNNGRFVTYPDAE